MAGYIDSHLHFWDATVLRYDWLDGVPALAGRHGLDDYRAATADDPPERFVFVQADTVDGDGGNEAGWVHGMCRADPAFGGIVAWAPVDDGSDAVAAHLDQLADAGVDSVCGVRRLIQAEPPGLCTQPAFVDAVASLAGRDLAFDVCIFPRHLADALALARGAPETKLVLDHVAKPDIAGGGFKAWHPGFVALAAEENVWCKLSGLVTEAEPDRWTVDALRPYVEAALEAFGPTRMMWGSDWPVVTTASTYRRWREASAELLVGLSPSEQLAIRSGTAAEVYGLDSGPEGDQP